MKILFATMPVDGHFYPLTGVAMHLKAAGHDVRWYAGPSYTARLERLGIPPFPFLRATEIKVSNVGGCPPSAPSCAVRRLSASNAIKSSSPIPRSTFEDLQEINDSFPFDALVCDAGFYAEPRQGEAGQTSLCGRGGAVAGNLQGRAAELRRAEAGQEPARPAGSPGYAGGDGADGHGRGQG